MKNIKQEKNYRYFYVFVGIAFLVLELLLLKEVIHLPAVLDFKIFQFRTYGVLIMLAVAFMAWVVNLEKKHYADFKKIHLDDLLLYAVIDGVIGARLYHIVTDWRLYVDEPWAALYIWNGGVGIFGAVAGGLVGIHLYRQKVAFPFWKLVDLIAVFMPVAQIIGRMGNLVNQELYGWSTDLPWSWQISGVGNFHPVFLYEQILNAGLLALLIWLYRSKKWVLGSGQFALFYIGGYSLVRFVVEFFRRESRVAFELFTVNQLVCIGLMLACAIIYYKIKLKS